MKDTQMDNFINTVNHNKCLNVNKSNVLTLDVIVSNAYASYMKHRQGTLFQ